LFKKKIDIKKMLQVAVIANLQKFMSKLLIAVEALIRVALTA
jgi:hypothetical protein